MLVGVADVDDPTQIFRRRLAAGAGSLSWVGAGTQEGVSRAGPPGAGRRLIRVGFGFAVVSPTTPKAIGPRWLRSIRPRRANGQGVLGHLVEGSLQLVGFPPLGAYLFQLA